MISPDIALDHAVQTQDTIVLPAAPDGTRPGLPEVRHPDRPALLTWQPGDDGWQQVDLDAYTWLTIGRSAHADLRFDHVDVSRRHAVIDRRGDGFWILDDTSLNGTIVNGDRVEARRLSDGDRIDLGRCQIVFIE